MKDVIEFYTMEKYVEAFKKLSYDGAKVVMIDDAEKHDGVAEYNGQKMYYVAMELDFED